METKEISEFLSWARQERDQLNEIITSIEQRQPLSAKATNNLKKFYYAYEYSSE